MRTTATRFVGLALALGALSSCTATGPIAGQLVVPGQPAQRVSFIYTTDRYDQGGQLTTTLPNGESFAGRFLQVRSTTSYDSLGPMWQGFGHPMWDDWGPFGDSWVTGPTDVTTFRRNYSGKVVATLFGDRGTTMRCRFRLVNPPGGIEDGGTGECQLSTGGKIDAQF
jgi:hypothetical protein